MIPEHFYITELGQAAYVVVYLPLVFGVLWLLYKKVKLAWPPIVVLALVLLALPFWDVYMIGRYAERLCREQGGLRVYRTVEVEGFLGGGSVERWTQYGFSYVESGGSKNRKFREFIRDGKVITEEVTEYISLYQLAGENHTAVNKYISRSSNQIISRADGEVLGELVYFSIYPGYFDGFFLRLVSSGPTVWICGKEPPSGRKDRLGYGDVVMAVLKPKK
jgi:hypothetical protein